MTIQDDTAIRIPRQHSTDPCSFKSKQEEDACVGTSDWHDNTGRAHNTRVLLAGGRGQGSTSSSSSPSAQWVSTLSPDFHTLTSGDACDLFVRVATDVTQTALLVNTLVCVCPGPEYFRFSEGALRVLQDENAGGASEFSESLSFELLHRVFGVQLVKTEMSIGYVWGSRSKKTDYSCRLPDGTVLAVSVTRAMCYAGDFTPAHALHLLRKKLLGVQLSNRNVRQEDRWAKQVLHVLTATVEAVAILRDTFMHLLATQPELVGSTVVLVTLTASAPFVYYNFCSQQAEMTFAHQQQQHEQQSEATVTFATCTSAATTTPTTESSAEWLVDVLDSLELEASCAVVAQASPHGFFDVYDTSAEDPDEEELALFAELWSEEEDSEVGSEEVAAAPLAALGGGIPCCAGSEGYTVGVADLCQTRTMQQRRTIRRAHRRITRRSQRVWCSSQLLLPPSAPPCPAVSSACRGSMDINAYGPLSARGTRRLQRPGAIKCPSQSVHISAPARQAAGRLPPSSPIDGSKPLPHGMAKMDPHPFIIGTHIVGAGAGVGLGAALDPLRPLSLSVLSPIISRGSFSIDSELRPPFASFPDIGYTRTRIEWARIEEDCSYSFATACTLASLVY